MKSNSLDIDLVIISKWLWQSISEDLTNYPDGFKPICRVKFFLIQMEKKKYLENVSN